MHTAIQTGFLDEKEVAQVQAILAAHGLSGFDASVRLWGRGKAIEVRGTLGRQELSCLLAIARYLGTRDDAPDSHLDADVEVDVDVDVDAEAPPPSRRAPMRRQLPAAPSI